MSSPQKKPVPKPSELPKGPAFQQIQTERIDQNSNDEDQQYKEISQKLQL